MSEENKTQIDNNKISELKKEIVEMNSKLKELSDDELQQVTGGSERIGTRRYSSSTYSDLGITPYHLNHWANDNQETWFHPLITTMFNSCSVSSEACLTCVYSEFCGLTLYCKIRSKENDLHKY